MLVRLVRSFISFAKKIFFLFFFLQTKKKTSLMVWTAAAATAKQKQILNIYKLVRLFFSPLLVYPFIFYFFFVTNKKNKTNDDEISKWTNNWNEKQMRKFFFSFFSSITRLFSQSKSAIQLSYSVGLVSSFPFDNLCMCMHVCMSKTVDVDSFRFTVNFNNR